MKKQKEKQKLYWCLILSIALVGAGVIKIVDSNAYTEQKLNTPHNTQSIVKPPEQPETSLKQHVWELLTVEGGLTFDEAIDGMAIIKCESNFDPYAIGDSGNSVGLWQIYKPAHPEITTQCRFDVYCSTREALRIYHDWGNSWNAWTCARKLGIN